MSPLSVLGMLVPAKVDSSFSRFGIPRMRRGRKSFTGSGEEGELEDEERSLGTKNNQDMDVGISHADNGNLSNQKTVWPWDPALFP